MHLFHALFTDALGGLEQAYLNVTQAFISKGHAVTALMHKDMPHREAVEALGAQVIVLRPRGFYDVFTAWKIRARLKASRPDLIVAHNGRAIALLSMAARGTGIPVCGVCHSHKARYVHGADALVALTEPMQEHFAEAGFPAEKIWVVPNLIHLPSAVAPRPRQTPPVIGAIGRFVGEKGFGDLLQALQLLKRDGIKFEAHIAGDGPQKQLLETMARDLPVRFIGWANDKTEFYRGLDALCVPSLYESFGLVVLEALAHGVPVVATDDYGPVSILTHEVNGLLAPRGNVPVLAEALKRVIQEPELAARLAENGFKRAQDYGFESVSALWDKTLKEIISANTSRRAA